MRRIAVAGVAGVVALGLVGCTAPTAVLTSSDGRQVLVATSTPTAFPQAGIFGEVHWSGAGCLTIATEWGGVNLLMMPHGTTVISEDEIGLDDGTTLRLPAEVRWGGGYRTIDRDEPFTGALAELPEECVTDEVAIVNPVRIP